MYGRPSLTKRPLRRKSKPPGTPLQMTAPQTISEEIPAGLFKKPPPHLWTLNGLSSEAVAAITRCLVADGHRELSYQNLSWIWAYNSGDYAECERIRRRIDLAAWSTMHLW